MFDIGTGELIALGAASLLIFGPEKLPKAAAEAGKTVRAVRSMIGNAKKDLTDGLGPEFQDLDLRDLNPRAFLNKHLLEDEPEQRPRGTGSTRMGTAGDTGRPGASSSGPSASPGDVPPQASRYDDEAT